ncbi:TetR/AcrR family transcriptional regulator [Psychromonas sp. GE-S-Ul-11]|uniref:TetR/AcrR family transcriptional regulator n=1 Tax=Psychromonas sp. GE-S-Ul-11 TaxID=3241170 RepID=UPI00390C604C
MNVKNVKAGRPKQLDSYHVSARHNLVEAAKVCFSERGYDSVSTRKIAKKANVDAAMIRYYFGSKEGLFEAVIQETLAPIFEQLGQDLTHSSQHNPLMLMQTYYKIMATAPLLPKLMLHVLNQKDNPKTFTILSKVFDDLLKQTESWINTFDEQGDLNPNLDLKLIPLSFISLMVFPLLAPVSIQKELGIELNEDWLMHLAGHNQVFLEQGLFKFSGSKVSDVEGEKS